MPGREVIVSATQPGPAQHVVVAGSCNCPSVAVASRAAEPAGPAGREVTMGDAYDLKRFVAAQDQGGAYDRAIAELRSVRLAG